MCIDKRAVLEENYRLAYSSPLVSQEARRLDPGAMERMLPGLEGDFKIIAEGALAGTINLGTVDPETYVQWWKDNGARIGAIGEDGKPLWNKKFNCEFCGAYDAPTAKCNKCEEGT
jgi:hypothetical protein